MLCQMCNKNIASTTILVNSDFGYFEAFVCENCSKSYAKKTQAVSSIWAEKPKIKCRICGTTAEEFEKSNYVGCERCYEVFFPEIEKSVYNIHGKAVHVGKVPINMQDLVSRSSELNNYMNKFNDSVLNNDAKSAREISSKIRNFGRRI